MAYVELLDRPEPGDEAEAKGSTKSKAETSAQAAT
jgi:hypothetical protein